MAEIGLFEAMGKVSDFGEGTDKITSWKNLRWINFSLDREKGP